MPREVNVGIVGAGGISDSHVGVLKSIPSVKITAVVDPQLGSAKRRAANWGVEAVYAEPTEVFAKKLCDVAHILVPPDKHKDVALSYIESGIHVFIEKPMCLSVSEATALKEAAQKHGVMVGVNHNLAFTPAHLQAKEIIRANNLGKIHHIYCYWNNDLALLEGKKYTHWMFQSSRNIFFEQAPHPLSQIYDLIGAMRECNVLTRKPIKLAPGIYFFDTWQVSMTCEQATAQFFYSLGQEFPTIGMIIICEGGTIAMDVMRNRVVVETSAKGQDFVNYHTGMAVARQVKRQSHRDFLEELKATFRLRHPADWQTTSMWNSIVSFYKGLETDELPVDVEFGTEVVRMCERITEGIAVPEEPSLSSPAIKMVGKEPCDVAVFGGTGFLGRHIVKRLVNANMRVNVMARGTNGLPEIFYNQLVRCFPGNIANVEDVEKVIGDAQHVIDLAFSFGDGSWDYMERVGIGGARNVAECCLRKEVKRLIYTSTIGVLDTSSPRKIIKDSTGPDPTFRSRDFYPRLKSICEYLLLDMHHEKGLNVCILRPGIVIGEDGNPYHPGVGRFYNKQHVTCFSKGDHPLPLVLIRDTAEAFYLALTKSGTAGKTYNLVGDVRLTAREYVAELSRVLERPIAFLTEHPGKMKRNGVVRWFLKMASGRFDPFPNFHEINCGGIYGSFDNQEIKRDLGWQPVADRNEFIREGIDIHRKIRR